MKFHNNILIYLNIYIFLNQLNFKFNVHLVKLLKYIYKSEDQSFWCKVQTLYLPIYNKKNKN